MTLDIIAVIILFVSAFMLFIPALPGIPFMFILTVVYGFLTDFSRLEPMHLIIFGLITLASIAVDWSAGLIGAKFGGASAKAVLVGFAGMVLGFFAFPPFGMLIGLFVGILLYELFQKRPAEQALKSATFSLIGTVTGVMVNVTLAFAYAITFAVIVLV